MNKTSICSSFCTFFIIFYLYFGLLFYNLIHFDSIDEILIIILIFYTIFHKINNHNFKFRRITIYFILTIIFYVIYSLFIHITSATAIISDAIQESKPFVVYLCAISLSPKFSVIQKRIIEYNCVFIFIITIANYQGPDVRFLGGHPTSLASLCFTLFIFYTFAKDKINYLSIIILLFGSLSARSKYYGEVCLILYIWFSNIILFKNTQKYKYQIFFILILMIIIIWPKFNFYFVEGLYTTARSVLYSTGLYIIIDFFPFGCGFGTFANHYSRVYYSPLYEKYNLDTVWGLSPDFPAFIADTYFPILGQFGVIGIILFIFFCKYIIIKSKNVNAITYRRICFSIIIFLFIDSIADTTFISNRGVLPVFLLGLLNADQNIMKVSPLNRKYTTIGHKS